MAPSASRRDARALMSVRLQPLSAPRFEATISQPRFHASEVIERYDGSAIDVAVALVRDTTDDRRERLEVVCAPDVQFDQEIEELLFRARSLYRQVHLTFVSGRDRALCLHMIYGVIAGLFIELDRAAAR